MIESLSINPVTPIQQRTATDEGDQTQPAGSVGKTDSGTAKSDSTAQSEKNSSQQQTNEQKKKLEEIVKGMNDFLQPQHISLKFKLYQKLNVYYCQVIDDNTKEVIREVPPKKLLDTYAIMAEQLGFIVDKKI